MNVDDYCSKLRLRLVRLFFCRIKSTAKGKENEMPLINAFSMQTMSNDCPDRKIARDNPSNNCAKLKLMPCPSPVLASLLLGVCRRAWGKKAMPLRSAGFGTFATTLASGNVTLFQNVRIFDGKTATLSAPSNVLVRDNKIERISAEPDRRRYKCQCPRYSGERTRANAWSYRRALACVHGGDTPARSHDCGRFLPPSIGCATG